MIQEIRVVGIDPAMANVGISVGRLNLTTLEFAIDKLVLVETESQAGKDVRKNSDDIRRARQLHTGTIAAIQGCSLAFIEVPVRSQSARAMASYGMCCMLVASLPVTVVEVKPDEVKLAAVGHKQAAKEEMIQWAHAKYPTANWLTVRRKGNLALVAKNEHLADATAAVHAGVQTQQFQQILVGYRAARAA